MIVRKKIDHIEFGLLSSKMIQKMSGARIYTPNTYDDDGYPVEGGLMDSRLGVIDPGIRCKTCGGRLGECQGHFGHVQLTRPVIHVGYAKEVYNTLRATCRNCSRILVSDETITGYKESEMTDEAMYEEAWAKSMKISNNEDKCPHCEADQVKVKFVRPYSYYESEDNLLVTDIRERFEKITYEDLKILNLHARPEWLILTDIPVIPPNARPPIYTQDNTSEDDLTLKLIEILRINQVIEDLIHKGAPQLFIEEQCDLLQFHVATYFDNGLSGIPPAKHSNGRTLKTIVQRLKSKEGRFRKNLSGKRVNFSARTVIGPDPNLSINEVGVPYCVAMELTVPEYVNIRNLDRMRKLIMNGSKVYPGAHNVLSNGRRKRILPKTKDTIAENLKTGDTVERMLSDGDIVVFNRQPSLHRLSMMAHKVRVLPYNTFRLNTAVCAPYNADFDGDEMNLHVPQSEEAIAEADIIMKVSENIISPRFGGPVIGGRHDHVSGGYLLTKDGVEFSRADALQITRNLVKLPKGKKFTGKDLFSLLLPDDLNFEFHSKYGKKADSDHMDADMVRIKKGKMVSGIIDAEGLSGCLLNEILIKYGSKVSKDFINKTTQLTINSFMYFGFSVGIDEYDLPKKEKNELKTLLSDVNSHIDNLIDLHHKNELKIIPGKSSNESLEDYIMMELAKSRTDAGKVAERFAGENSAVTMAKTGARGSLLNLTQMSGCVGQQAVRGSRIQRGYHLRTISHFKQNDLSPEAEGFVRSNYKRGLRPTEYFFHSMGGREGLVDSFGGFACFILFQGCYGYQDFGCLTNHISVDYASDNFFPDISSSVCPFFPFSQPLVILEDVIDRPFCRNHNNT